MKTIRRSLILKLAALPIALAAVALVLAWGYAGTQKAQADNPHAGLDFSIAGKSTLTGTDVCDSGVGGLPDKCSFTLGQGFVISVKLNALGGIPGYLAFRAGVGYIGVSPGAIHHGPGGKNWPDCVSVAQNSPPGTVGPICQIGLGAPLSTYTGSLVQIDFTCSQSGTITLLHAPNIQNTNTVLVQPGLIVHGENSGSPDALQINCVPPPALGGVAAYPDLGSGGSNAGLVLGGSALAALLLGAAAWRMRKVVRVS